MYRTSETRSEGYQVLFVLNPLSTCWTVSGTMALSGAPLIFPSIDKRPARGVPHQW